MLLLRHIEQDDEVGIDRDEDSGPVTVAEGERTYGVGVAEGGGDGAEVKVPSASDQHRCYAKLATPPKEATTCTLDRNCRGMAILEEETYHAAMEDVYTDAEYYKIIESDKDKAAALRNLHEHEVRWKPGRLANKKNVRA